MSYENKTYDTIKDSILEKITTVNRSEGSFVNDMVSPVSLEIGTAYREFDKILAIMFLDNLENYLLEVRAMEYGLVRKEGTRSEGSITFSGVNGTVIPAGTMVSTISNLKFMTTTQETIVNGVATATIKSEFIGSKYNVEANKITNLPVVIVGVASVTNSSATNGGTDTETDDNLRNRLLYAIQNPSSSGCINDYKKWSLAVDGVGDVKVFPLWNGPGTVQVVIINSNKEVANSTLVNSVSTYIESVRPIGAAVSVISATAKAINISAKLNLINTVTITSVKATIEGKIKEHIKRVAFKSNYISYAQIGSIILDTEGVIDYVDLKINNATSNIIVAEKEVAVLGTVTFS